MITSKVNILGYQVFADNLNKIKLDKQLIINTLNGHSYSVAKKDLLFQEALHSSDILLPDGSSVTFGVHLENGIRIPKIAGYDVFIHLLNYLNKKNGSCYFLGSMTETLSLIENKINVEFPNIRVGSFSPPYVQEFSVKQSSQMCEIVNDFHPDVLFVGMTAPKQEKWVHKNKNLLDAKVICSIGAVFDFYAGTKKRPANWMIKCNLEWLGRFLSEPRRLFHRYFISTPSIFIDLFLHKFHIRNLYYLNDLKPIKKPKVQEIGKALDSDINYHYKILEDEFDEELSNHKYAEQD